jgi:hypothetical protein
MDATDKDSCEYIRLLFRLGRIDKQGAIEWADSAITNCQDAPLWAIEIAMAGSRYPDELESLLLHVPGDVTRLTTSLGKWLHRVCVTIGSPAGCLTKTSLTNGTHCIRNTPRTAIRCMLQQFGNISTKCS